MTVKRIYRRPLQRSQAVLSQAEAYWDLRYYDGGTSLLDMQGRHPAVLGSTAGADSNDPLYLPYAGTPYLYLPGTAGNYASVPDAAALDITGDIDIRCKVALTDWTPASESYLVNKENGAGNRSWLTGVTTGGNLVLYTSADGTARVSGTSTAAVSVTDGASKWIRYTLDVDDGGGNRVYKFYTSTDYDPGTGTGTWTQLGSTVTTAGTTSIFNSNALVEVGAYITGAAGGYTGTASNVQIYSGIAGTKVLDIDFTALASYNAARTSLTAVTGQEVTINRSATGRKAAVVERNDFLGATDDYAEGSITLTGYPFAMVWAGRGYATAAADALFTLADASAANVMYGIHTDASGNFGMRAQNTTAQDAHESGTKYDDGLFHVVVAVFRSATDRELYIDGVSAATDANSVTFNTVIDVFSISRWGDSSPDGYADCEFIGAGIWFREPTLEEIRRLNFEWAI